MTINEVYKLVQAFASKDQRGFITPAEFNLMAQQAELELYNERLQVVMEGFQVKKNAGYYNKTFTPIIAEQDINPFYNHESFTATAKDSNKRSTIDVDTDYVRSLSTLKSGSTKIPDTAIDIVNPENVSQLLKSSLVKPSTSYPVALISGSGNIELFPKLSSKILVSHYYYNNIPNWGYVTVAGKPVYSSGASTQFKISSRCHGELVIKILGYLGVSIREADLVNYAQNKEAEQDKQ